MTTADCVRRIIEALSNSKAPTLPTSSYYKKGSDVELLTIGVVVGIFIAAILLFRNNKTQ
jgi:hypothetical protein